MTSSTAFSRSRSENLKALISACASPNSRSLSAQPNTTSGRKRNQYSYRDKSKQNQARNAADRAAFRTSDFILEPIELHLDRIRAVKQVYELVRVHTWPHLRPPPRQALPFLERSRHRQRRRLHRRRSPVRKSTTAIAGLPRRRKSSSIFRHLRHSWSRQFYYLTSKCTTSDPKARVSNQKIYIKIYYLLLLLYYCTDIQVYGYIERESVGLKMVV